ncbi:hypothetical protein [Bowmanella sp. JS7-9]|uniref:DUF4034 domain-containing protein n=1 Tax=Pseudobowmanella zhangzhouensis TaxID=1537679 RepID=A0ABW1XLP7_9ALTE|nr:hypothetical protein [Bowmanella sp. JS7-9]
MIIPIVLTLLALFCWRLFSDDELLPEVAELVEQYNQPRSRGTDGYFMLLGLSTSAQDILVEGKGVYQHLLESGEREPGYNRVFDELANICEVADIDCFKNVERELENIEQLLQRNEQQLNQLYQLDKADGFFHLGKPDWRDIQLGLSALPRAYANLLIIDLLKNDYASFNAHMQGVTRLVNSLTCQSDEWMPLIYGLMLSERLIQTLYVASANDYLQADVLQSGFEQPYECAFSEYGWLRMHERELVRNNNYHHEFLNLIAGQGEPIEHAFAGYPKWVYRLVYKPNRATNDYVRLFLDRDGERAKFKTNKPWYEYDFVNLFSDILATEVPPHFVDFKPDLLRVKLKSLLLKQFLRSNRDVDMQHIPSPLDGSMPQQINGTLCYLIPNDEPVCLREQDH